MVSTWWLLAAFLGGGGAGMLLMALMCMAGLSQEAPRVPEFHGAPS